MPLEVGPGLSRGTSSSIQLKNGRYPATERGNRENYSNIYRTIVHSTMLSGCQLNHMLPTWTDQLDVSSSQWGNCLDLVCLIGLFSCGSEASCPSAEEPA